MCSDTDRVGQVAEAGLDAKAAAAVAAAAAEMCPALCDGESGLPRGRRGSSGSPLDTADKREQRSRNLVSGS